ncbi:MAG: amidohydrolase family protein [Candidatus Aminicenantes bacterium]|nr:amidohydrolase family protein [Candidatus Aminicenantes bacterium]
MRSKSRAVRPLFLGAVVWAVLSAAVSGRPAEDKVVYDILFVNGQVIDGSGNPWFHADVGVQDGRIAAVGKLKGKADAARVVDVRGKIVAPGFIDIHTHTYDNVVNDGVWTGPEEIRFGAPNYLTQGVTTVVSNSCGYGPPDLKVQRDVLRRKGTGPNVFLMIGHNSVRRAVLGSDFRRPARPDEVGRMSALVRQAMADGAAGMSSGLEYVPAIWSTKEEVVALVKELVPYDGVYMAHERSSGLTPMWYVPSRDPAGPPTMIENIQELIEVSETSGARVVAAHIKARGADFWGASGVLIRLIEDARARGVDIWADCYPYTTSGSDGSAVLLPDWALGKTPKENLEAVLRDPEKAEALERDIRAAVNWRGGAENILIMDYPDKTLVGQSLAEVARNRGLSAVEAAVRLQLEGFPNRPGGARLRGFSLSELDIEAFYRQPWVATSSDGSIALPGDGPVHARFYGTFPRKIRRYALERKVQSVENAIRSMTSLPALILGLRDRGMVREGFRADLVVFDPRTVKDTATFFEPHQPAAGVDFVLVNGTFVVEAGQLTGRRPGLVLAKN